MINLVKKMKSCSVVVSIILCILGIILMVNPNGAMAFAARAVGAVCLVMGLWLIIKFFAENGGLGSYLMVFGFLFALTGLFIIIYPMVIMGFILSIIGMIILIRAFLEIKTASDAQKLGYSHWNMLMIIGTIKAIAGLIIIFVPFFASDLILRIVGVLIVIETVTNIVNMLKISKDIEILNNEDDSIIDG